MTKIRVINKSDLVGVWVGISTSGLEFYRVELAEQSQGRFTVVYKQQDVSSSEIIRWTLSEKCQIGIDVAKSSEIATITKSITGKYEGSTLLLTVVDDVNYANNITLCRETDWNARAKLAIEGSQKVENSK